MLRQSADIFASAGVKPQYHSLPAQRILDRIRSGDRLCSIGWFSTEERQAYARFSLPIYRGRPVAVTMLRATAQRVRRHASLRELLADRSMSIGLIKGHSEGKIVDALLREIVPFSVSITGNEGQRLRMLAMGRVDYILQSPEDIDALARAEGLEPSLFERLEMPDIPSGNLRYVICGSGVPPELMKRLDTAILGHCGDLRENVSGE